MMPLNNQIKETSALNKLHNNAIKFLILENIDKPNYIWMIHLLHDLNLSL
jgi:hypothetical protein